MHEQTFTLEVWDRSFREEPFALQKVRKIGAASGWRVALPVKSLMAAEMSHQKCPL